MTDDNNVLLKETEGIYYIYIMVKVRSVTNARIGQLFSGAEILYRQTL